MSINGFSHENDHSATNHQVLVPSELKKKKKKKTTTTTIKREELLFSWHISN
jgi:hypothetical protein